LPRTWRSFFHEDRAGKSSRQERIVTPKRGVEASTFDQGRTAVYGSTQDNPERHFIGWFEDVNPDELFASGRAWGLTIVRRRT
jgi:hypothetical protein